MSDFRYSSPHDLQHSGLYTPSYFQTVTSQDPHRASSVSHNDTSYTVLGNYHYADKTPGQSSYLVKSSDNHHLPAAYTIEDNAKLYSTHLLSSPSNSYLATRDHSEKLSPASDHYTSSYTKDYPYTSHLSGSTYDHKYISKEAPKSSAYPGTSSHVTSDIVSLGGKGFKYEPSYHTTSSSSHLSTPHKFDNDKTTQDLQYIDKIIAEIKTRHAKIHDLQSSTLDTISYKTDSLSHKTNYNYERPLKSSYTSGYGSTYGTNSYKSHYDYSPSSKYTPYDEYSEFKDCTSTFDKGDSLYSSGHSISHRNIGEKVKSSGYRSSYVSKTYSKKARSPLMIGVLAIAIILFILAFYFMLF